MPGQVEKTRTVILKVKMDDGKTKNYSILMQLGKSLEDRKWEAFGSQLDRAFPKPLNKGLFVWDQKNAWCTFYSTAITQKSEKGIAEFPFRFRLLGFTTSIESTGVNGGGFIGQPLFDQGQFGDTQFAWVRDGIDDHKYY